MNQCRPIFPCSGLVEDRLAVLRSFSIPDQTPSGRLGVAEGSTMKCMQFSCHHIARLHLALPTLIHCIGYGVVNLKVSQSIIYSIVKAGLWG